MKRGDRRPPSPNRYQRRPSKYAHSRLSRVMERRGSWLASTLEFIIDNVADNAVRRLSSLRFDANPVQSAR